MTVTLITLNEERNLPRALASVRWADEVVVIDAGSEDRTRELAAELGARVIRNPWPGYGQQKNFAQRQASHDWVLNIDADEEVSPELREGIEKALAAVARGESDAKGFHFARRTHYLGRWIRHGGWYPNRLVRLADRRHAAWTEPALHEELKVEGPVRGLDGDLLHYTFSNIEDQVRANLKYARLGSRELRSRGLGPSLPRLVLKPLGKFVETYVWKAGFLDGLAGFVISVNAMYSMFLKYAYLHEREATNGEIPEAGHAHSRR